MFLDGDILLAFLKKGLSDRIVSGSNCYSVTLSKLNFDACFFDIYFFNFSTTFAL